MAEQQFKLMDKYDVSGIEIKDRALVPYINLFPRLLLKSQGRNTRKLFAIYGCFLRVRKRDYSVSCDGK